MTGHGLYCVHGTCAVDWKVGGVCNPGCHFSGGSLDVPLVKKSLTPDPTLAPGHTDLMVSPETIDAFVEANPFSPATVEDWPGGVALFVAGVCVRKWNEYEDQREARRLMRMVNEAVAK